MFEVVQVTPISSNVVFSKSQNPGNVGGDPLFGDKNRAIWRLLQSNGFKKAICMNPQPHLLNPIPTSQGRIQLLYEHHVTMSGRNRVKPT